MQYFIVLYFGSATH